MNSAHASLIRTAQQKAVQYPAGTGALLESLVRELSRRDAQRVLDLVGCLEEECRRRVRRFQRLRPRGLRRPRRTLRHAVS
jgi:hypothetical protein